MQNILTVNNLTKSYGDIQAVRGISFGVQQGSLFAFLGQNGAGKSTTIEMLCTLQQPTSGSAAVAGYALGRQNDEIRKRIGVVFQNSVLDPQLTVAENLTLRGSLYGLRGANLRRAVHNAAQAVDMLPLLTRRYGKLSGGQRRRADIARALLCTPEILFLDEPTTGLDPKTKVDVWQTVRSLQQKTGMTVFLTTHYMEEAAQADSITVLNRGVLAAQGTPAQLQQQYSADELRLQTQNPAAVREALRRRGLQAAEAQGALCVRLPDTLHALPLLREVENLIDGFEVAHGTLEDAFIHITEEANKNA